MSALWKILGSRRFMWPMLALPGLIRLVTPALSNDLGFNPLQELLHRTGQIAVWTLFAVLALSPLKAIAPSLKLFTTLNRHRRVIGVSAFVYTLLHVCAHFLYEGEFRGYFENAWKPFFLAGTIGFLIFLVLAITSNDWSVKKLGYRAWKWIHRLAYVSALVLLYHMGTAGKGNWPAAQLLFGPLLGLQMLRFLVPLLRRKFTGGTKPQPAPTVAPSDPTIAFQPSGTAFTWNPVHANLLTAALANGIKPTFGCRVGRCGACRHGLITGRVRHSSEASATIATDEVLLCCAQPEEDVTIEFPKPKKTKTKKDETQSASSL